MPEQATETELEVTIQCGRFREYINAVDAVVDEAVVRFGPDGLSISAVDPANVAMVEARLYSDAFEEYDADETAIGASIYRLGELLEHFEDDELLTLRLKQEFKKLELETGRFSYTYAYISPDSIREEPDLPKLDLSASVEIENEPWKNAVEYFDEFATHVTVGYSTEEEEFYMDGEEKKGTDDGQFRLPRSDLVDVESGVARSLFSLDYTRQLSEGLPEEGTVKMEIGEEFPMKMKFGIIPSEGSRGGHYGRVEYMQAPRIQTD